MWISYTDKSNNQVVQGAAVTNLGSVGTFSAAQSVTGGTNGDFGDIVVGPAGQVMVIYQNNTTTEGPDTIHMNLNTTGLGGTFGAQSSPTVTQVGGLRRSQRSQTVRLTPKRDWLGIAVAGRFGVGFI